MRIGITCFPTTGGSGIVATELGLHLAALGHDLHFVCYDRPHRLAHPPPGVTFHQVELREYPLPQIGQYPLALATALARVAQHAHLDVLHMHYAVPHAVSAFLAVQLLRATGQPVPALVTTLHGTDVTQVGTDPALRPITSLALSACAALTTPSAFLRDAARQNLDVSPHVPIEVIPNAVDATHFAPLASAPTSLPFRLVHGSNFRPLKRIDDLIQMMAALRPQFPVELVLMGDGPEKPRLVQQVSDLGLTEAVQFVGMVDDPRDLLRTASLFLLPSSTEGFGLAALEAQSCGVPVVASRVGGIPEVVVEGETGLLFPPGDVTALTACVQRLLLDPALRQRLAHAARARAVAHFSVERIVRAYLAVYTACLDRR